MVLPPKFYWSIWNGIAQKMPLFGVSELTFCLIITKLGVRVWGIQPFDCNSQGQNLINYKTNLATFANRMI